MNSVYVCSGCGHRSPFYLSECPRCGRDVSFEDTSHKAAEPPPAGPAAEAPKSPGGAPLKGGELRVCHSVRCDYKTREPLVQCPRCGQRLLTAEGFRTLGIVLVVIGGVISVGIISVGAWIAYLISRSGEPGSSVRFTGSSGDMLLAFGILGLVLALGISFAAAGFAQILRGRRSPAWIRIIVILVFAFMLLGTLLRFLD